MEWMGMRRGEGDGMKDSLAGRQKRQRKKKRKNMKWAENSAANLNIKSKLSVWTRITAQMGSHVFTELDPILFLPIYLFLFLFISFYLTTFCSCLCFGFTFLLRQCFHVCLFSSSGSDGHLMCNNNSLVVSKIHKSDQMPTKMIELAGTAERLRRRSGARFVLRR